MVGSAWFGSPWLRMHEAHASAQLVALVPFGEVVVVLPVLVLPRVGTGREVDGDGVRTVVVVFPTLVAPLVPRLATVGELAPPPGGAGEPQAASAMTAAGTSRTTTPLRAVVPARSRLVPDVSRSAFMWHLYTAEGHTPVTPVTRV